MLEQAFQDDIGDHRLVPYIQLYEFEAILFSDPEKFGSEFPGYGKAIQRLHEIRNAVDSPELINEDPHTAPSKRIIGEIPDYKGRKPSSGPLIAQKIGLETIRTCCPHFDQWLSRLEALAAA